MRIVCYAIAALCLLSALMMLFAAGNAPALTQVTMVTGGIAGIIGSTIIAALGAVIGVLQDIRRHLTDRPVVLPERYDPAGEFLSAKPRPSRT